MSSSYRLGDDIKTDKENSSWSFAGGVPLVFESHVNKSVPLYVQGHDVIEHLSSFFLLQGSLVYDIGCSTGLLLRKLAQRHKDTDMQFIGFDKEASMISEAQKNCKHDKRIKLITAEIQEQEFEPESADMIISYYTMQFIRPKYRTFIFNNIFKALNWGGAFIFFEKIRAPDARFQDYFSQIHFDMKKKTGYSDDEILSKSRSLKGVLEPYTSRANVEFMQRAGFKDIVTIVKYLNFEGFLAIK